MRRICVTIIAVLLLLGMSASVCGASMTETEVDEIRQALESAGVKDSRFDLNVKIHVPKSENPYIPKTEEDSNIWATVIRPKASEGEKLPTILIGSGYTRMPAALAMMIVPQGYNMVVMDLRGTGSSGGTWPILDLAEQYDVKYVIDDWIPSQEWSDGKVGYIGMSYLAIIGSLAAGLVDRDPETGEPDHLKAMFILSMMSDAYQGAGGNGGNVNIELLSTWIGMTSIISAMPPFLFLGEDEPIPDKDDIKEAVEIWVQHILQIPKSMGMIMDYENAVDGEFWDRRSAMVYWPVKPEGGWGFYEGDELSIPSKLPIFTGTGWFDLFTRGVCNYYEYGLSGHKKSDKAMIIGEWSHVGACAGFGLKSMETFKLQLRWFDWKLKNNGKGDCFMKDFPVIIRVMGENRWRAEKSWPLPDSRVENKTLYLSKAKAEPIKLDWFTNKSSNLIYSLVDNRSDVDFSSDNPVLEHKAKNLHGLTSRSTQRWLYGGMMAFSEAMKYLLGVDMDDKKVIFWEDERYDDLKVPTFTTDPLEEDVEIVGPVLLTFWAKTAFPDEGIQTLIDKVVSFMDTYIEGESSLPVEMMTEKTVQWVAELDDVFPDGRAKNITSGWLNASHRQYDPDEASTGVIEHELDNKYEPFDPFYDRPDKEPKEINEDELYQYAIELWPTCNVFKAGNRIRVTLSGSDIPHLLPVLRPSSNTIVIDEDHMATLEFKTTNSDNEGEEFMWIGPAGYALDDTVSNYLIEDTDVPDPEEEDTPADSDDPAEEALDDNLRYAASSSSSDDSDGGCFISTSLF